MYGVVHFVLQSRSEVYLHTMYIFGGKGQKFLPIVNLEGPGVKRLLVIYHNESMIQNIPSIIL